MSIVVRQNGGLGNQLFEYAAALYFAKHFGGNVEILLEDKKKNFRYGHPRHCMLSAFNITAPIRDRNAWDRLMCSEARLKWPLAAAARLLSRTQPYREHFNTTWTFLPKLPVPSSTRNLYLEGCFQAFQYADAVEDQLRRELTVREAPSAANRAMLDQIQSSECPVSLHIRRGDYKLLYRGRDVLPLAYMTNAMDEIRANVSNPTFFVFSDEMDYARETLSHLDNIVFVDINDEWAAVEDLRLMAACHHHIIANSTFSWWGAWLNPNPNKIVCAPDVWRDPKVPVPDLLPQSWRRIPTGAELIYEDLPRFPPEYESLRTAMG